MSDPRLAVGAWTYHCCEIDLHRITTVAEVLDILESWHSSDDMEEPRVERVFATREAAWDAIFPYQLHDPSGVVITVHRPLTLS